MPVTVTLPPDVEGWAVPAGYTGPAEIVSRNGDQADIRWIGGPGDGEIEPVPREYIVSKRTVPPPHHTRKLRELIAQALLDAPETPGETCTQHRNAAWVRAVLRITWQPTAPLPPGTAAAYLRLRAIPGKTALVALSAALRGTRCCPPGARYAPVGWAEYLKNEAVKAAKDAQ